MSECREYKWWCLQYDLEANNCLPFYEPVGVEIEDGYRPGKVEWCLEYCVTTPSSCQLSRYQRSEGL
jgi:hypothetical protein